jgi:hypothetical protein
LGCKTLLDACDRLVERDSPDGDSGRERGKQTRRHCRRQDYEHALVALTAYQPSEGLRKPCANHPIVVSASAAGHPPGSVEHGRPGPRHAFHHDQAERFAGNVDSVA